MRKGYSIIELLVAIGILALLSIGVSRLYQALLGNIPRDLRVVQSNAEIRRALNNIRNDIDRARSLPISYGNIQADETMLLIELPDKLVSYQLSDDKITRRELDHHLASCTQYCKSSCPTKASRLADLPGTAVSSSEIRPPRDVPPSGPSL